MNSRRNIIWGSDRNALVYLAGANAIVFIAIRMLYIIFHNNEETVAEEYRLVYSQFVIPQSFSSFIQKPWTLFTYFFSHLSLGMLLSNLLWLFSFAWLLQNLGGNRYVFPAYFYGGIVGGIAYLLTGLLPAGGTPVNFLVGATPAILALSVTTVTLHPNYRIFPFIRNGIPLWVLLAVFLVIDIASLVTYAPVLVIVHLLAALSGFWYAKNIQRGRDYGAWMGRLGSVFTSNKWASRPQREQLFYDDDTVAPYERRKKITQGLVDDILDKISRKGYGSLSDEEKDILKKAKDEL